MLSHVSSVHQCNPELMQDHIPEADNRAYEREWEIICIPSSVTEKNASRKTFMVKVFYKTCIAMQQQC